MYLNDGKHLGLSYVLALYHRVCVLVTVCVYP